MIDHNDALSVAEAYRRMSTGIITRWRERDDAWIITGADGSVLKVEYTPREARRAYLEATAP